jgi:hypothetical protein
MTLTERLQRQLQLIRTISERILGSFTTPEQWTHQVHAQANHALWFAGHVGMVDNFLLSLVDPTRVVEKEDYRHRFGMGSRPTANPADYPDPKEVLAFMRERREAVLDVLAGLSDSDLSKPTPEGAPYMMPDIGAVFEAAVWHEALHAGQVTIARRDLGHPPLVDAPPAE